VFFHLHEESMGGKATALSESALCPCRTGPSTNSGRCNKPATRTQRPLPSILVWFALPAFSLNSYLSEKNIFIWKTMEGGWVADAMPEKQPTDETDGGRRSGVMRSGVAEAIFLDAVTQLVSRHIQQPGCFQDIPTSFSQRFLDQSFDGIFIIEAFSGRLAHQRSSLIQP